MMVRPIIKFSVVILGIVLTVSSCYYDVEQELYPSDGCNTDSVTYSNTIVDILTVHECIFCHNTNTFPQGGVALNEYNEVKIFADNGSLLGSIKHESNFTAMPQNAPQIPKCDIAKIERWIELGALNN